jgi:phytoene dehydrogenase-like protein
MGENTFDAVVIGSGLGGLTAAALLAKAGRKVCVIERNHSVGGAASAFKKGALTIEPALHQTADPRDPTDIKHGILAELGILDEIEWVPVRPFYSVRGGPVGDLFDMPVGFDAAHHALSQRFPKSREGSARFFGAIEQIFDAVARFVEAREERSLGALARALLGVRPLARDWRASTAEMLERFFGDDEGAKCAVGATIGYYHDDARQLAWPFFAVAQAGFFKSGGVFVKGGSRVLSMKLAKVVMKAGGSVLLGRDASGVDLDASGSPVAVRHVDSKTRGSEQRIEAKQILANCAPQALAKMLPDAGREKIEAAYGARPLSISLFSAHFGVSRPPAELGFDRYSLSVLPEWARKQRDLLDSASLFSADPGNRLPSYGIANYGAIDSGLADGGPSLVTVVGVDRLDNWSALSPQEEKDRRERWLDAFQAALDRDHPGFAAAVSERMFLSARSMANFMNTPGGAVYGFAPLPFERGIWAGVPRSPRTPLPGVYLASSFGQAGGFSGAMGSGADAARVALKEGAR